MMHLDSFQNNSYVEKHEKNNIHPQDAVAFKKLLSQITDNEPSGMKRCDEYQPDYSRLPQISIRPSHPVQQNTGAQTNVPQSGLENCEVFQNNMIGFGGHCQPYLQSMNIPSENHMYEILKRPEAQAIIEGIVYYYSISNNKSFSVIFVN